MIRSLQYIPILFIQVYIVYANNKFKFKYTITTNRRNRQKILENRKRMWFNKSGRFVRVYFFHPLIQQEEIWKVAEKIRIELWNQLTERYIKEVKC